MGTIKCLLNSGYGIYIPRSFVESYDHVQWNIKQEDYNILLAGPDQEYYWETWDDVTNYAYFIDENNIKWSLYLDGDLFAVNENHVWED